jgi:hypothetical protein
MRRTPTTPARSQRATTSTTSTSSACASRTASALEVKRTDFRQKQVLFRVLMGEGRLTLSQSDLALGWMAERVFEDGGLGAHTIDELRRILAGKQVGLSFSVGQDAFAFGGATTVEDLQLQCAACART